MQPATTSLRAFPVILCRAISRMVSTDSCLAVSIKEQVFTTITSASSACVVISAPPLWRMPIMTSLSTRFLGHPRLTKPTLTGFATALEASEGGVIAGDSTVMRNTHCNIGENSEIQQEFGNCVIEARISSRARRRLNYQITQLPNPGGEYNFYGEQAVLKSQSRRIPTYAQHTDFQDDAHGRHGRVTAARFANPFERFEATRRHGQTAERPGTGRGHSHAVSGGQRREDQIESARPHAGRTRHPRTPDGQIRRSRFQLSGRALQPGEQKPRPADPPSPEWRRHPQFQNEG